MARLKVPSLQHLARNWKDDPDKVCKELVNIAKNPPIFSYNPLFGAIRDMLVFKTPYDDIVKGIHNGVKREDSRRILLSVLPLIHEHFSGIAPDYVNTVSQRFYPAGRDLKVPFDPPLIYGVNGEVFFPWFSFWRNNPIAKERLALFVSIVDDVLLQDPDLEKATFQILDFSIPKGQEARELRVIDANQISRLTTTEKKEMLEIFAEGYTRAEAELAKIPEQKNEQLQSERSDDAQPGLFDRD